MTLLTEDAPQRTYSLREVFNGLRWIARSGAPWRLMPNDLPPWYTGFQQTQRWIKAGVLEAIVHDLRALLRVACGRNEQPSATIIAEHCNQAQKAAAGPVMTAQNAEKGAKYTLPSIRWATFWRCT